MGAGSCRYSWTSWAVSRPRRAREWLSAASRGMVSAAPGPGLGPSPGGSALRRPVPTGRIPRPAYQAGLMSGAGKRRARGGLCPGERGPGGRAGVCSATAACPPGHAGASHPTGGSPVRHFLVLAAGK